jgi:hypothetical protein
MSPLVWSYVGNFCEIAVIGRVAYFVSLSVGAFIALVSFMILTEPEEESVISSPEKA